MPTTMLAARACDGKRQTFKCAREAVLCGSAYKRCQRRRLSAMPATMFAALPYGRAWAMPCGNAITAPFVIGEDVACTSSMITAVCVWSVKTLLHTLHKASHALPYGNAADVVAGIAEKRRR